MFVAKEAALNEPAFSSARTKLVLKSTRGRIRAISSTKLFVKLLIAPLAVPPLSVSTTVTWLVP